jgi:hypothetical protein
MDIQDFRPKKADAGQIALIKQIEDQYVALAGEILRLTAPSAHRTAALRLLLESKMTMTHSITHP